MAGRTVGVIKVNVEPEFGNFYSETVNKLRAIEKKLRRNPVKTKITGELDENQFKRETEKARALASDIQASIKAKYDEIAGKYVDQRLDHLAGQERTAYIHARIKEREEELSKELNSILTPLRSRAEKDALMVKMRALLDDKSFIEQRARVEKLLGGRPVEFVVFPRVKDVHRIEKQIRGETIWAPVGGVWKPGTFDGLKNTFFTHFPTLRPWVFPQLDKKFLSDVRKNISDRFANLKTDFRVKVSTEWDLNEGYKLRERVSYALSGVKAIIDGRLDKNKTVGGIHRLFKQVGRDLSLPLRPFITRSSRRALGESLRSVSWKIGFNVAYARARVRRLAASLGKAVFLRGRIVFDNIKDVSRKVAAFYLKYEDRFFDWVFRLDTGEAVKEIRGFIKRTSQMLRDVPLRIKAETGKAVKKIQSFVKLVSKKLHDVRLRIRVETGKAVKEIRDFAKLVSQKLHDLPLQIRVETGKAVKGIRDFIKQSPKMLRDLPWRVKFTAGDMLTRVEHFAAVCREKLQIRGRVTLDGLKSLYRTYKDIAARKIFNWRVRFNGSEAVKGVRALIKNAGNIRKRLKNFAGSYKKAMQIRGRVSLDGLKSLYRIYKRIGLRKVFRWKIQMEFYEVMRASKELQSLTKKIMVLGGVFSGLSMMGTSLLTVVGGIGATAKNIAPALAPAAGIMASLALGAGVLKIAFAQAGTQLKPMLGTLNSAKKTISDTFWSQARMPMLENANKVFAALNKNMTVLSANGVKTTTPLKELGSSVGMFIAGIAKGVGKSAQQITDTTHYASLGFQNMSGSMERLVPGVMKLVAAGAKCFPAFGKWIDSLVTKFDAWLTGIENSKGGLDAWVNNGVKALAVFAKSVWNLLKTLGTVAQYAYQASGGVGSFADRMDRVYKTVSNPVFAKNSIDFFRGVHEGASAVTDALGGLILKANGVGRQLGQMVSVFGSLGGAVIDTLGSALTSPKLIQGITAIGSAFTRIIKDVAPAVQSFASGLGGVFEKLGGTLSNLAPVIGTAAQSFSKLTVFEFGYIAKLADIILPSLVKVFNDLAPKLQLFAERFMPSLTNTVEDVVPVLENFTSVIGGALLDGIISVTPVFMHLVDDALPPLADIINRVTPIVADLVRLGFNVLKTAITLLSPVLSGLCNTLKNVLSPAFDTLKTVIDPVCDAFDSLASWFKTVTAKGTPLNNVLRLVGGALAIIIANGAAVTVISGLGKAFAAVRILGFVGSLQYAGGSIASFVGGIASAGGKMGFFGKLISRIGLLFKPLGVAFNLASVGVKAFGTLFSGIFTRIIPLVSRFVPVLMGISGPFAAIAAVVGVVSAALVYFFTKTETGQAIVQSVVEFISGAWESFKELALGVWDSVSSAFSTAWTVISTVFSTVWGVISTVFSTVWGVISPALTTGMEVISATWSAVWGVISTVFSTIWTVISTVFSTVWATISPVLIAGLNVLSSVWSTVWGVISTVFSTIWNTISTVFSTVWGVFSGLFTTGLNVISGIWSSIWGGISTVFSTIWNTIKSIASGAWGALKGIVVGGWNTIMGFFSGLKDKVFGVFSKVWDAIKTPFQSAVNGIKRIWNTYIGGAGFSIPSWVPFVGGKRFEIPKLAEGGIAVKPTVAMIAEAGYPEAVIPLPKLQPMINAAVDNATGKKLPGSGTVVNIGRIVVPMEDLAQLKTLNHFINMLKVNSRMQGVY